MSLQLVEAAAKKKELNSLNLIRYFFLHSSILTHTKNTMYIHSGKSMQSFIYSMYIHIYIYISTYKTIALSFERMSLKVE